MYISFPQHAGDKCHIEVLTPRYVASTLHIGKLTLRYIASTLHIGELTSRRVASTLHMGIGIPRPVACRQHSVICFRRVVADRQHSVVRSPVLRSARHTTTSLYTACSPRGFSSRIPSLGGGRYAPLPWAIDIVALRATPFSRSPFSGTTILPTAPAYCYFPPPCWCGATDLVSLRDAPLHTMKNEKLTTNY